MIKESFGKTIQIMRKTTGKTQEQTAEETGLSYRYFQKLEAGDQTPHYLNLFKLAETLQTTPDVIIKDVYREWVKAGRPED